MMMSTQSSDDYLIYGIELSPYSVKVRSYFRYKNIPHQWIIRSMDKMPEFNQFAKLPLIPLVVTPDSHPGGKIGIQDSTPIIETMEALHPDNSIYPDSNTLHFISDLIEEFADEWGNKPMFHYRWFYEADQESGALRIAQAQMPPGTPQDGIDNIANMVKQRMIPRISFVGSSQQTKDQIENAFKQLLAILEIHLANRPYLFGGKPSMGDFGLFAQLYECSIDPTPGSYMKESAPNTLKWISRMLNPAAEGEFESWEQLKETLFPLLKDQIGAYFLPWSTANAKALAAGQTEMEVTIAGKPFKQEPQKYHAKSLEKIKSKYLARADAELDGILDEANCLEWLR